MEMSDGPVADAMVRLVQERLSRGESVTFTIISDSMLPWLAAGGRVLIQPATGRVLRVGDVVIAPMADRRWITHRIIHGYQRDGRQFWVTKGDSNSHADAPLLASEIWGIVAKYCPPGAGQDDGPWFSLGSRTMRSLATVVAILSRTQVALAGAPVYLVRRYAPSGARRLQQWLWRIAGGWV